jgi:pimeloyl-ACP methyl ester carboxylesterase
VKAGDVELHVAELGPADAPPLLLVHGWPQHWWCWRQVAPELAGDHRVLMPDLRGFGWSDTPRDGYEKEQFASDMLALLDAVGIERAGYIGHDWGGFTGLLLGLRAPERLTGLLVVSIPHVWASRQDQRNPRRLVALAYQGPLSTPLVGERIMRAGLTARVLRAASSPGTFSDDELRVFDEVMRRPERARATVAVYRTFLLHELLPLIRGRYADARLALRARLMMGEDDPIGRGADLRGHERNAPELTVERVPGAGHFLPEERPDVVVERARELFSSTPRAA